MRAEYKRDMNHNYLILHQEEELDTASYQIRMLLGNVIPSVLKSRIQGMDGKFMVYYDITSKQSVVDLFEERKFRYEDLQLIFKGFVQVMEEMSEYLLNPGRLVIRPEYMYVDMEKRELFFCYLPGYEEDVKKQFQSLTEYILPKLDHEDSRAVMLGYSVYRRALEDIFQLENIKEELYRENLAEHQAPQKPGGENGASYQSREETVFRKKSEEALSEERLDDSMKEDADDFWKDDEWFWKAEKENGKKEDKNTVKNEKPYIQMLRIAAGCGIGALFAAVVLLAKVLGYIPWVSLDVLLGSMITGAAVVMLGWVIYRKVRDSKAKESPYPGDPSELREQSQNAEPAKQRGWYEEEKMTEQEIQKREEAGRTTDPLSDSYETTAQQETYGETVVLSSGRHKGPASLVSREPGELATIFLQEELTVIGKLVNAADAVIDLPTVSRVHAKIRRRDGEYYLTDLNSRNGTAVNGQMLKNNEEHLLQDQDEVDFAEARYIFLK